MEQGFKYYAFISYKREDEKWAKWLQNKLETYKIPISLAKEKELPKTFRPCFRDKTDLSEVGDLSKILHDKLQQSQYLILICSPRSAKSKWVNKEVETFMAMGREDKIFPFIIEGCPEASNPTIHCYPPTLDENILGISVPELGKEKAVVKTIAAMSKLDFDELWNRHRERILKKRIKVALVSAVILAIFGIIFALQALEISGKNKEISKQNEKIQEQYEDLQKTNKKLEEQINETEKEKERAVENENHAIEAQKNAIEEKDFAEKERQKSEVLLLQTIAGHLKEKDPTKALRFLEIAYEKALSYKLDDGQIKKNILDLIISNNSFYLSEFIGHNGNITSFAISPNERWVVSAADDKSVKIWDIFGNCLFTHMFEINRINSIEDVSFSDDGNFVFINTIEGHSSWYRTYNTYVLNFDKFDFIGKCRIQLYFKKTSMEGDSLTLSSILPACYLFYDSIPESSKNSLSNNNIKYLSQDRKIDVEKNVMRLWGAKYGQYDKISSNTMNERYFIFRENIYSITENNSNTVIQNIHNGQPLLYFEKILLSPDKNQLLTYDIDSLILHKTYTDKNSLNKEKQYISLIEGIFSSDRKCIRSASFSQDGKYVLAILDHTRVFWDPILDHFKNYHDMIKIWDIDGNHLLNLYEKGNINWAILSKNTLISCILGEYVTLWDISDRKKPIPFYSFTEPSNEAFFISDGEFFILKNTATSTWCLYTNKGEKVNQYKGEVCPYFLDNKKILIDNDRQINTNFHVIFEWIKSSNTYKLKFGDFINNRLNPIIYEEYLK